MAKKSVRIPITNVHDGNDYTAEILIGSQKVVANVILDTGSSALAVKSSVYDASQDTHMKPTTFVQSVPYGSGGWAGPIVSTNVCIGMHGNRVTLKNAPVAVTEVQQRGNFMGADGILGLAYDGLNEAFDFKSYFAKHKIEPAASFPWPFPGHSYKRFAPHFIDLIRSERVPLVDIETYFDTLEEENIIANKFAFYTLRSRLHCITKNKCKEAEDPLNKGFFIMGGGEDQTDLYTGEFLTVKVLDDFYYNTNLKAVQVEGCPEFVAHPLQAKYKPMLKTNSMVDSGTNYLALPHNLFESILESFQKFNPGFIDLIKQANNSQNGVAVSDLNLSEWPHINFILEGNNNKEIKLNCSPQTYWQVDYPSKGQAVFQVGLSFSNGLVHQSLLGLPLLNNYYTVFDRSCDVNGVVKFAPIKLN